MNRCQLPEPTSAWTDALYDIQRPIIRGTNLQRSRWLILRIEDAALAREFLAKVLTKNWVSDARIPSLVVEQEQTGEPQIALNIAFSWEGLRALRAPDALLRALQRHPEAESFVAGARKRARSIGDDGPNRVELWDPRYSKSQAHILISIHADSNDDLDQRIHDLRQLNQANNGLSGWDTPIAAAHLGNNTRDRRVHFGFRDGISQPTIRKPGTSNAHVDKSLQAEAGEFVLGYSNNCGRNPWSASKIDPELAAFVRNGSFAACRQIAQDVEGFEDFVKLQARNAGTGISPDYIKAKLCGRWPNGALVQDGQTQQPPDPSDDELNNFNYANDAKGRGCPWGAHTRRNNPRADPILERCVNTDSGDAVSSRLLMRRGMPYGPPRSSSSDDEERGLIGLFICASLQEQFEHVMSHWVQANPNGLGNPDTAKDPLIGNQGMEDTRFHIPRAQGDLVLKGFDSFCTTRGGIYVFFPSLSALREMSLWET